MPSVLIRMRPDVYEIFPPFPFSPYRLQGIWRGCWTLPAICQILCHIRQRGKHPYTSPWEITDSFLHSLKPFHCKGVGFEARSWEQAFPKTLSVRVRVALSILFQVTLFVQEGRTRWLPEVPSSLNHAVILWTTHSSSQQCSHLPSSLHLPLALLDHKLYHLHIHTGHVTAKIDQGWYP